MNRYDHYVMAENILKELDESAKAVVEAVKENPWVNPQTLLDYNRTLDVLLRKAQIHATLANTPDGVL